MFQKGRGMDGSTRGEVCSWPASTGGGWHDSGSSRPGECARDFTGDLISSPIYAWEDSHPRVVYCIGIWMLEQLRFTKERARL